MRTSERVFSSRFPVESAGVTPVASPADVAPGTTPTGTAPSIVFMICVLAVAARLLFINQPYIDHWSWRQSDVAAIIRNFLQNGFHFGYPQIDWAGNAPGYVGTEFPILPFVAALCYKLMGVHEWMGRIQGGHFVRGFAAIFLFACPRDLWEHGGSLGDIFLQLCTSERFCWPLIHAGCSFA